jgi:hypothetical protein
MGHRPSLVLSILVAAAVTTLITVDGCGGMHDSGARPSERPPAAPARSSTPPADQCLSRVTVVYPPGDNPLRSACLRVGATVTITLQTQGAARWRPVVSSDRTVVAVRQVRTDRAGTLQTSATAMRPGAATLHSAELVAADPHGPPGQPWTLSLRVVG